MTKAKLSLTGTWPNHVKRYSISLYAGSKGKVCFSHLTYFDSDMIFQLFCSLFVVTHYDVDGCLNLGPSEIGYHVHLVDHSTRVGVLLFAVSTPC